MFAKIFDETFEKLQDDKKSQQIGDDEAERLLQFTGGHNRPDFKEHFHQSHREHEHENKMSNLKSRSITLLKRMRESKRCHCDSKSVYHCVLLLELGKGNCVGRWI